MMGRILGDWTVEVEPVFTGDIGTDVSEVSHYGSDSYAQRSNYVQRNAAASLERCCTVRNEHWTEKGMLYVAECMAKGALRLIEEPGRLKEAWRAHQE